MTSLLPRLVGIEATNEGQLGEVVVFLLACMLVLRQKSKAAAVAHAGKLVRKDAKRLPSMGLAPAGALLMAAGTLFFLATEYIPVTDAGKAHAKLLATAKQQAWVDGECTRRNLPVGERLDWSLEGQRKYPACYQGIGYAFHGTVEKFPELRGLVQRNTPIEAKLKAAYADRIKKINSLCDRLGLGKGHYIPDSRPEAIADRRLQEFRCYTEPGEPYVWILKPPATTEWRLARL